MNSSIAIQRCDSKPSNINRPLIVVHNCKFHWLGENMLIDFPGCLCCFFGRLRNRLLLRYAPPGEDQVPYTDQCIRRRHRHGPHGRSCLVSLNQGPQRIFARNLRMPNISRNLVGFGDGWNNPTRDIPGIQGAGKLWDRPTELLGKAMVVSDAANDT